MKTVFAGSPEYAVPSLEALIENGFEVTAVITQPDRPVGRKKVMTPTPVKAYAAGRGIRVYDFDKIRLHVPEIRALGADLMMTCAYGQLLTKEVLDCFPKGVWNLHASLLPEFRGASPIQSAILAGKTHTGVTVMKTELALDTGDILLVKRCEIGDKTYGELSETLSLLSADAAVETLRLLEKGQNQVLLQDEARATYCKKIDKSAARIDFSRTPEEICRLIRAMNPEPVAYCLKEGETFNILRAEPSAESGAAGEVIGADKHGILIGCNGGAVLVTEIIPAGGKRMRAADYVNGRKIKAGDRLD